MDDIETLVGERLMIGLPGATLRDDDVRLFRETRAAGLILYRRNFESPDTLRALLSDLESALGRRLLVATDHEGGRIVMLGGGVTIFPDNLAVGTAGEETFAFKQGVIEARELRRLGVDLNLGPCLDVLTERYSPNIGIRSYGKDPQLVARYGSARIRGMARGGLSACPKHFPGKGHSPLDAHLRLPTIDSDWDEMHAVHLVPFFAALEAGVECVMTSHPVYPKLDPAGVPATFSRLIVHDYLRGEVGFQGAIVSDDLEMGAVAEACPIGEATVRAAGAGHDLLLVCHTEAAQRAAADALVDAYRGGRLPRAELEPAAARVRALRERRTARFADGAALPEPDGEPLAKAIATRAVTEFGPGAREIRRALNGRVAVVFPRFSELAPRITIEPAVCNEAGYIAAAFGAAGIAPETLVVGIEPTETEIAAAAKGAAVADATVLFLYDGHLYASNRALLEAVQGRARALAVVLLRDPYDASLLAPGVTGLTAYGWRRCQLDAVIARLAYP
ncbi:MAG TPA: beta-N-acetylhexosaminidase [Methylomirabilota bacterium]|jgi:beta-N-acetylhexosaminidase|nr:beta-N-acetylhexosaminidase [Methylomirabilota bacterium]